MGKGNKMKFEKHKSYKRSGLKWWDEEIPTGWEILPFKNISYMKGRIGWQNLRSDEFTFNLDEPFLITGMNFKDGKIRWDEVYHVSDERYFQAPEIQLKENDVLITKDGTIGKVLFIDNLPGKATLNSHLLVLRPLHKKYFPKYLYYTIQSSFFQGYTETVKTGTTFFGITQEAVGNFKMLIPPHQEQRSIAAFLDRETARIDALIEKKKKLIELLKEKRTALITRAVTKGLNPGVKMKPSGIEWLGEIPEHWSVIKLGHYSKWSSGEFLSNLEYSKEKDTQNNIPVLGGNGIMGWSNKVLVNKPIIVIGRVGALCGNVHYHDLPCWISDNALQLTWIKGFNLKFLTHFLTFIDINRFSSQTAQPLISGSLLSGLKVVLPPIEEQVQISKFIEYSTLKIEHLLEKINFSVARNYEYRTALISAAVTGKIRVGEERGDTLK